jgi:thioredoxin-related protein
MRVLFITLIISTIFGCYSKEPEKTGKEGQLMPTFKLLLTDSVTYFDSKDISTGKPTVLFFYGPNCPYSRAQMKDMIEEKSLIKNIHFYVFTTAPFSEMKIFNTNYQLNKYLNITSGLLMGHSIVSYFNITGVPFTAIYDKDKKLIHAFQGKIYSSQIIKVLEE